MRAFVLIFAIVCCVMTLAWSAVVEQQPDVENSAATTLFDVDSAVDQNNQGERQVRQFFGGYYRPYYGYNRPYYYRPYYGYGYYRPYYSYYRPYYGGFGYYG